MRSHLTIWKSTTSLNKTLVNLKLAATADSTSKATFDSSALTANRNITVPDTNITLVGTDATQILENKTLKNLILADDTDITKKLNFDLSNLNTATNRKLGFPATDDLNTTVSDTNVIVLDKATQTLENKFLITSGFQKPAAGGGQQSKVTIDTSNITADRSIKFPDADATLLSTQNVSLEDVTFGAGIGANNLTGQTRLQQFFYAGF